MRIEILPPGGKTLSARRDTAAVRGSWLLSNTGVLTGARARQIPPGGNAKGSAGGRLAVPLAAAGISVTNALLAERGAITLMSPRALPPTEPPVPSR